MIHRSEVDVLELRGIHPNVDGNYAIRTNYFPAMLSLIAAVEKSFLFEERISVLRLIARALKLNFDEVIEGRRFRLLTRAEMIELHGCGVDIQLHTHTHRLPPDAESTAREITLNRESIREVLGQQKDHFCYPSGMYTPDHVRWLEGLGVRSATTCDTGLNPAGTHPLLLRRFLDREDFDDIQFEAEICGLNDLGRELRGKLLAFMPRSNTQPAGSEAR